MVTKSESRRHTKVRMEERYGYSMTKDDYNNMIKLIKKESQKEQRGENCVLIKRQGNENRKYVIKYDDRLFTVIYNKRNNCIKTVLPPYPSKTEEMLYDESLDI